MAGGAKGDTDRRSELVNTSEEPECSIPTRVLHPKKIPDTQYPKIVFLAQNIGYIPDTRYPTFLDRVDTHTHPYPSFVGCQAGVFFKVKNPNKTFHLTIEGP